MVDTDTVIESLARSAHPVRRLPSPGRRVVRWLAMGLPVIGLFGIVMGARVPIVLTSRSDSRTTRLASCAIALMLAERRRAAPP